jgi:Transposase DDE domain
MTVRPSEMYKKQKMTVKDLLTSIPNHLLDQLCAEYDVNWNIKKLYGQEFFKLCLFGILNDNQCSTRILSSYYQNAMFRTYAGIVEGKVVSHSSIAERLEKIDLRYFEDIFHWLSTTYRNKLTPDSQLRISRYDSTTTSLSSKLLKYGITYGQKKKGEEEHSNKSIKFSIGYDGLPFQILFQRNPSEANDNLALGDILKLHTDCKNDIAVFDRGMQDRQKLAGLSENAQFFVTRLKVDFKFKVVPETNVQTLSEKTETLQLISEQKVYLYSGNNKLVQTPFRLIQGTILTTNEPIFFLSNLPDNDFSALDICNFYKKRWDIECFFRFIKQELNLKHYFSHSWNGIQVMTYMILIAALLLLVFKYTNELKGYRLVKKKFLNELQDLILKDIIIQCGGNPELLHKVNQT